MNANGKPANKPDLKTNLKTMNPAGIRQVIASYCVSVAKVIYRCVLREILKVADRLMTMILITQGTSTEIECRSNSTKNIRSERTLLLV